VSHCDITK